MVLASTVVPLNDRRFLRYGIPLVAGLKLVPRGLFELAGVGAGLVDYSISLTFTAVLWLGVQQLWSWLLRRWPWPADTTRRLWWLAASRW